MSSKISIFRNIPDVTAKQTEYELAQEELSIITEKIDTLQSNLDVLESTQIEESGIIRVQDILHFLDKNLSTDVIYSVIERSVADELYGMHDYFGKFQQMLPAIITIIIVGCIGYLMITGGGGGDGMLSNIGQSVTGIVPNIGAP